MTSTRLPRPVSLQQRLLVITGVSATLVLLGVVALMVVSARMRTDLNTATTAVLEEQEIADRVIASTMHQRKQIRGLVPMRYDMIVICCMMVDHVLESLGLRRMRMSTWSLKEGAMVEFVKQSAE